MKITLMALIITVAGKPFKVNRETKLQSPSIVISSGSEEVSQSHQPPSIILNNFNPGQVSDAHHSSSASARSLGQVTRIDHQSSDSKNHLLFIISGSSLSGHNPHSVIINDYPDIAKFSKIDFNCDSEEEADPVRSDFSVSKINASPLEESESLEISSDNSTKELESVIVPYLGIPNQNVNVMFGNFNSVAQDVDPVKSDFSASKITDVPAEEKIDKLLVSDLINKQKPPTTLNVNNFFISEIGVEYPFSSVNVTKKHFNESDAVTVVIPSGDVTEVGNYITDNSSVNVINETTLSIVSVNEQESVTMVTSTNPTTDTKNETQSKPSNVSNELSGGRKPSGEISVSTNSINDGEYTTKTAETNLTNGVLNKTQKKHFNSIKGEQGSSVVTGSVNGQEPVTIVTATNPATSGFSQTYKVVGGQTSSGGISVSTSSINGQENVTVVTATNPAGGVFNQIQNKPVKGRPGGQSFFGGMSASSSSVNGQEPVTIVTATHPATGNFSQTQNKLANLVNSVVAGQAHSVSSSSINGQIPVTVVTASNFATGIKHKLPNLLNNLPCGQVSSGGISISSSSFNGQKPVTVVTHTKPTVGLGNQIQNQHNNVVGSIVGTSAAVSSSTVNGQTSTGSIVVSSSSSDGQKSQTIVTYKNPQTGQVTQTKYESSPSNPKGTQTSKVISSNPSEGKGASRNSITIGDSQTQSQSAAVKGGEESGATLSSSGNERLVPIIVTANKSQHKLRPCLAAILNRPVPGQIVEEIVLSSSSVITHKNKSAVSTRSPLVEETVNELRGVEQNFQEGNTVGDKKLSVVTPQTSKRTITVSSISGNGHTTITAINPSVAKITQSTARHSANRSIKDTIFIPRSSTNNEKINSFANSGSNSITEQVVEGASTIVPARRSKTFLEQRNPSEEKSTEGLSRANASASPKTGEIISTSYFNGKIPVTIITSNNPLTGETTLTKYVEGQSPGGVVAVSSITVNSRLGQTTVRSRNPAVGEVTQVKYGFSAFDVDNRSLEEALIVSTTDKATHARYATWPLVKGRVNVVSTTNNELEHKKEDRVQEQGEATQATRQLARSSLVAADETDTKREHPQAPYDSSSVVYA